MAICIQGALESKSVKSGLDPRGKSQAFVCEVGKPGHGISPRNLISAFVTVLRLSETRKISERRVEFLRCCGGEILAI